MSEALGIASLAPSLDLTDVPGLVSVRVAEEGDHTRKTIPTQGIGEIRAAHHRVAALIANDYKVADVERLTGFRRATIQKLIDNPAFSDLVAHYSAIREERLNDLQSRSEMTSLRLLDEIDARLDDEDQRSKIPFTVLSDTAMKMLDRAGQGPVRKLDARVVNFTPQTIEAIRDAARSVDTVQLLSATDRRSVGSGVGEESAAPTAQARRDRGEGAGV